MVFTHSLAHSSGIGPLKLYCHYASEGARVLALTSQNIVHKYRFVLGTPLHTLFIIPVVPRQQAKRTPNQESVASQ